MASLLIEGDPHIAVNYWDAVDAYLEHCFSIATSPRVDELANRLGMHPSALSRGFKSETGRNLSVVLKERQVVEAKRLLSRTRMSTCDVARYAGFGTANTLFRIFRTRVGVTPEQYRRRKNGDTKAKNEDVQAS